MPAFNLIDMITKIKNFAFYLKNKILDASIFTFEKINSFSYWFFKSLILNYSNFLIGLVFLLIFVFYQGLISVLNFEAFGKEFTIGTDLNSLIVSGFEELWNYMISFVRSYSPSSVIGLAFELITEAIAIFLFLLGHLISFSIVAIKYLWKLIITLGIYNILVVISWLYVIGLFQFLFNKISPFFQMAINGQKSIFKLVKKENKLIEETLNLDEDSENRQDNRESEDDSKNKI
jgi:hypothetical protein|tara:strand:+ start:3394 stop:4092 length:699 start_codon:yes stop_codon:yes gene_type:complete